MADEVIRTQTAENDRIGTWLEKWYGRAVDDEHMDHHEDMQVLRKRPAPSSRFASSMSFHQPQAIELAREVATPP